MTPAVLRRGDSMTTEERFERMEHITDALVEERRKDREEYRQFWRDTQRRMDTVADLRHCRIRLTRQSR